MTDNPKDAERLARLREFYKGCAETDVGIGHPVFLLRLLDERDATIARLREERDTATRRVEALEAEVGRLRAVIERDRTAVAEGIAAVGKAVASREWMTEGRGSYAYNDDRYQAEFGQALEDINIAIAPLKRIAADWTDSPTDWPAIQAARAAPAQPSAADHTERARKFRDSYRGREEVQPWELAEALRHIDRLIAAALAAERADAEKMRALDEAVIEAARASLILGTDYDCTKRRMLLRDALAARDAALADGEGN